MVAHRTVPRDGFRERRALLGLDVEFVQRAPADRIDVERELLQRALVGVEDAPVVRAQDEERQGRDFDQVAKLRLALAQHLLQPLVLRHEALRDGDARHEQHAAQGEEAREQHRLRRALRLAERGGDRLAQARERRVDARDALDLREALVRRDVAAHAAQLVADRDEIVDVVVGALPEEERLLHGAQVAEAAEEVDHRLDVGRVVAPVDEPLARDAVVGIGLGQLDARAPVGARHGDLLLERVVVLVFAVERVAGEVEDRVLLGARPLALGADERASRGKEGQAVERGEQEQDDDAREDPGDHHEAPAARDGGEARKGGRLDAHDGKMDPFMGQSFLREPLVRRTIAVGK